MTHYKFILIFLFARFWVHSAHLLIPKGQTEEIKNAISERDFKNLECYSAFMQDFFTYFDASSKIPNGISSGNFYDLGDFEMCYGQTSLFNNNEIDRKYCLNTISALALILGSATNSLQDVLISTQKHSPTPRFIGSDYSRIGWHLALCVPSICQIEDIQTISDIFFNTILGNLSIPTPQYYDDMCYSKDTDPELSQGAIGTIVFLSIVFGIVVLSSVYDYYLIQSEKKPAHEILLAFSAISNGKKLLSSTTNPDQLVCINGIRAISMAWVVLGHCYSNLLSTPVMNILEVNKIMSSKRDMWLSSAPLSVDTFFTLGGLVTVYSFLRARDKGVNFNIILYYVHRYLRLTPAVAVILLIHYNLLVYMGNGPLWLNVQSTLVDSCQNNWWSGLLYIQNFVNTSNQCIPQTWYLSVDFQLFILSPIVLYPLMKWPKVGKAVLGVAILLGFIIPTVISYHFGLSAVSGGVNGHTGDDDPDANTAGSAEFMKYYYTQTYSRFGPYVIGMLFGLIIYRMKSVKYQPIKTRRNVLISMVIWVVAVGGMVGCIYDAADLMDATEYNRLAAAFYNGFNRNAWVIGVNIVVLLCVSGFGGFINSFLSCSLFQFISKLSYSIYLVHYAFIILMYSSARTELYFSHFTIMHTFWGHFMYSLALSVVLSLCFESPVIILEKYLLSPFTSSSKDEKEKKTKIEA